MQNITIARNNVNTEALDAALRDQLGNACVGISVGNGQVIVHLTDEATSAQITSAQQIVANHDPEVLTDEQQAEQDRQQRLAQLRPNNRDTIQPDNFAGQLNALAQKIEWLELELAELRGRG